MVELMQVIATALAFDPSSLPTFLRQKSDTTVSKLSIRLESPLVHLLLHYQEARGLRPRSEVTARGLTLLRDCNPRQHVRATTT